MEFAREDSVLREDLRRILSIYGAQPGGFGIHPCGVRPQNLGSVAMIVYINLVPLILLIFSMLRVLFLDFSKILTWNKF